jgi:aspartyl/glutamyl-tRNA(Asn/Gln) amidotransferase C subunit
MEQKKEAKKTKEVRPEDIDALAKLARITLSAEEKSTLLPQIEQIVQFFSALDSAPNISLENQDMKHEAHKLREDLCKPFAGGNEGLLQNAPQLQGRLYKTPPII